MCPGLLAQKALCLLFSLSFLKHVMLQVPPLFEGGFFRGLVKTVTSE